MQAPGALCLRVTRKTSSGVETKIEAASAFVWVIKGRWFLTTAGHVLKEFDRIRTDPYTLQADCSLFDAWFKDGADRTVVPFPYWDFRSFAYDNNGVDFAIIPVPELVVNCVASNVKPFTEEAWRTMHSV